MTLAPFPDVEVTVMDGIEEAFPALAGRTVTVTPADLQTRLNTGLVVRVGLVTGRDDRITSYAVVDVDVFARTRADALTAAEEIRQWLLGYPRRVGTAVIDTVTTETAPSPAPWEDAGVRRYLATYRISTRR